MIESIDSQEDFKTYMQQYALNWQMSGQRGPRREVPNDSIGTYVSNLSPNFPRFRKKKKTTKLFLRRFISMHDHQSHLELLRRLSEFDLLSLLQRVRSSTQRSESI